MASPSPTQVKLCAHCGLPIGWDEKLVRAEVGFYPASDPDLFVPTEGGEEPLDFHAECFREATGVA